MRGILPILLAYLLATATGCGDQSTTTSPTEQYPDLPVGISSQTSEWLRSHEAHWTSWEAKAKENDPESVYLHSLRMTDGASFEQIREFLYAGARSGLSEGRFTFGMWLTGQPSMSDKLEGVSWIREAAIRDYAPAQWEMAKHYRDGALLPRDQSEEARYTALAADGSVDEAIRHAAVLVVGGQLDADAFVAHFEAIASPNKFVRYALADVWLRTGTTDQRKKAREYLTVAFTEGVPQAGTLLGLSFVDDTDGETKDPKQALEWLEKANTQGDDLAALSLIDLYRSPSTLGIDPTEARLRTLRALELAAGRSNPGAQHALARRIESTNRSRAIQLYSAAASAQHGLALPDSLRLKHAESPAAVESELRNAAALGNPYASLVLAELIADNRIRGSDDEVRRLAIQSNQAAPSARAAMLLARYYAKGENANSVETTRWLSAAAFDADEPQAEAVRELIDAYTVGKGVPVNPEIATQLRDLLTALSP